MPHAIAAPVDSTADEQLAQRYAPIIMVQQHSAACAEGEPDAPASVDSVLGQPGVVLRWARQDDPARAPTVADLSGRPDAHLDLPGDPLNPGCAYEQWSNEVPANTRPTVYAHVASDPGHPEQLALQYWFFWVYNDWNDRHEGDWEMVQLVFDASTPPKR